MAGERTFLVKFISDTVGFASGIKSVSSGMGSLKKSASSLMPSFKTMAISGAAAFTAVSAAAYKAVQGAAEDQKSQALLAKQLQATTGATTKQVSAVEDQIKAMMLATGVADDKLRPAFAQLVRATGSVSEASDLMKLSLDVSAGSGKGLEETVAAISKAATGNVGALSKLGIPLSENIKKSKDMALVTDQLNKLYGGAAATAANTFAGRLQILKTGFGEIVESVGYALMPALEGAMSLITTKVMPVLGAFGSALDSGGLAGGFDFIATRFKESAPKVLSALGDMISQAVAWIGSTGLPMLYAGVNQLAGSLTGWIEPRIPEFINSLTRFLMSGYKWIYTKGLPQLLNAVQQLGDTLASFVGKAARQLPAQLVNMLATIGKWVLSDGIPALLGMGARLAGSLIKWSVTIGGQLIAGLGGAVVALVAALPDLFVGFVKGLGNIATGAVQWFISKFDDMKTGLANIAVSVVNTLIDVFNKIPLIPNIPKITLDTQKMGSQIGLTSEQLQIVNEKFDKVNGTLKVSSDDMKQFAGSTAGAGAATAKAGKAIDENKKKLDEYNKSIKSSQTLQDRLDKSKSGEKKSLASLTQANDDLSAARAKLNQVVKGYGAGSPEALAAQKEVDKAQRAQERATFGVEEAIYSVADAEKNLADVRSKPESSPVDIRRAEINLAEAKLSVTDAIDSQIESTQALNDQQSMLNDTIFGATIGSLIYQDALTAVEEAERNQVTAFEEWQTAVTDCKTAQDEFNASLQATIDLIAKYPKVLGGMPNPMAGFVGQPKATTTAFNTRSGDTYAININAAIAEAGLPQKVVDALKTYNATVGKVPVRTN